MKKLLSIVVLIFLFIGLDTNAQTYVWTGNSSSNWSDAANWNVNYNSNNHQVPGPNAQITIGWFSASNPDPVFDVNTTIKSLSISNFGRSVEIKIADGVTVTMDNLSIAASGNPPGDIKLNVGNGNLNLNKATFISGGIVVEGGTVNFLKGLTLNSSARFNVQTGTVNIGSVDTPNVTADFTVGNNSVFNLNAGTLNIYGESSFQNSGAFNAGSGTVTMHGNITFSGATTFNAEESTVILDGNISIEGEGNYGPDNGGQGVVFNDLVVTGTANVNVNVDVIVENSMDNQGEYEHVHADNPSNQTTLNVIGEVTGDPDIDSTRPYLIVLEVVDSHTLRATFNQALDATTAQNAANYAIKNSIKSDATTIDNITQAPVLTGADNNIVTITTDYAIHELSDLVLWITNVKNLNNMTVNNPHKKKFVKDFITWKGTQDSSWAQGNNWDFSDSGYPSPNGNYTIRFASNATHDLVLPQDVVVKNVEIKGVSQTGKKLDLNGHRLVLTGAISLQDESYIDATDENSTVILRGSKAQKIPANAFKNNKVDGLYIDNAKGVSIDGDVQVTGVLNLTNGQLTTNDHLVLKSSANRTAVVAPVANGTIYGKVTVEKYFAPKRAYRYISSPISSTGSIHDNWQEGVNNPDLNTNLNPNPGYGIHITGSKTGQNGFDATSTGTKSLYKYNNATQSWETINNTLTSTVEAGVPYAVIIRGDRSIDVTDNETPPTGTTIRTTGQMIIGDYTSSNLTSGAEGYNFIGNPYQAQVDMSKVFSNNPNQLTDYIYVWNPYQGQNGAYVTVDVSDFDAASVEGNAVSKYLQPGQGAFVQTRSNVAVTPTVLFKESNKQTTSTDVVGRGDLQALSTSSIRASLYSTASGNSTPTILDGFLIKFGENYSNEVNDNDGEKFYNTDETLAIKNGEDLISIEKRAMPQPEEELAVFLDQMRSNNYVLKLKLKHIDNVTASLYDNYLQTSTELTNDEENLIAFNVDPSIPESIATNRFKIVFKEKEEVMNVQDEMLASMSIYPNPVSNGVFTIQVPTSQTGDMNVGIYNILGQQVYKSNENIGSNNSVSIAVPNLSAGTYIVKIQLLGKSITKKLIVQ